MSTPKVDPRDIAHTFTLPDGTPVIVKHITQKDFEELDVWVRQQFMKNATDATRYMNAVEKQEFMIAALKEAAKLTFQYGDGRDILYGSAYGMARLMYQMIQNPPMSFEQFKTTIYPDGFVTPDGLKLLGDMLSITNTGEVQPDVDTLLQKVMELNPPKKDGTIDAVVGGMLREAVPATGESAMAQEVQRNLTNLERLVDDVKEKHEELAKLMKG